MANSAFARAGLTNKFESLYLRFVVVVADNYVFQNPRPRKPAERQTV